MSLPMTGRIALITGANSGIGFVTALRLAEKGAEILMVCRDRERGEAALSTIAKHAPAAPSSLYLADLGNQASIRALSDRIGSRYEHLDVLVNNAGAVFGRRELTTQRNEKTFATNHLAPFLLTLLLLPLLRRSPSARVVTVSSRVHAGAIDFDDLQGERSYSAMQAYGRSKLENILFTYELARRLGPGSITANCLAPGLVSTNFGRSAGGLISLIPRLLSLTPLSISPEEGAKTSVFLASAPEVEGVTGQYFYKCRAVRSKPISYDRAVAGKLWQISEELTGISLAPSATAQA